MTAPAPRSLGGTLAAAVGTAVLALGALRRRRMTWLIPLVALPLLAGAALAAVASAGPWRRARRAERPDSLIYPLY